MKWSNHLSALFFIYNYDLKVIFFMTAPVYEETSLEELTSFLDDIQKNSKYDNDTDFKKVVLYLFGFTRSKLHVLQRDGGSGRPETKAFIKRLIDSIELVLSNKRYLLHNEITRNEKFQIIHLSPEEEDEIESIYEVGDNNNAFGTISIWSILFFLYYLPLFPSSNEITTLLKQAIVNFLNLTCCGIHDLKFKSTTRKGILIIFERKLDAAFGSIVATDTNFEDSIIFKDLLRTVHLFTVLYDNEISQKLLLHLNSSQHTLELYSRKLWFLLNSLDSDPAKSTASYKSYPLIDGCKASVIVSLTNKITQDECISSSVVTLLLTWISEKLKKIDDFYDNQYTNPSLEERAISYALLRVFIYYDQKNCLESFINSINLNIDLSTRRPNFPKNIMLSLKLIKHGYKVTSKQETLNYAFDDISLATFDDYELDALKEDIIQNINPSVKAKKQIKSLLSFPSLDVSTINNTKNEIFNHRKWISKIKSMIDDDMKGKNSPRIFDDKSNLYSLISTMGKLPCIISEHYNLKVNECIKCGNKRIYKSLSDVVNPMRKTVLEVPELATLYKLVICDFILGTKYKVVEEDPIICSNFLLSTFSLLCSYRIPAKVNSSEDKVFWFTIHCLRSHSNREVRILASRILPLYLLSPKDELLEATFSTIFKQISSIRFDNESGNLHLAESTIRTLGELAIISEGEWLCALLFKLIDIFGETNEQHVNFVYNNLLNISACKRITPYKLLFPFLPSIAERIVKQQRMLQKITELLGVSKKYFLSRTKEYTTPRLLEYYKYDFIQDIALSADLSKLHLVAKNLPRIVAMYLCKDDVIRENYIIDVLSNISPEYRSLSMLDLVTSTGEVTWFILLQIKVNDNGVFENEKRITNALTYVSKIGLKKKGKKTSDKINHVQRLLDDHVLELVQKFSENVHHIKGTKPYLEKVSSLRAMEFLISKNTKAAVSALGQISTCLQATLQNSDFELHAIRCWNVLVQNLQTEHLISLFDIIISLIFQKFNSLEYRSKLIAVEILKKLFLELRDKYNKYSLYYFSIPFIDNLDKYFKLDSSYRNLIKPRSRISYFPEFTRRLQTSNYYVVKQALEDLINYTNKYQIRCQSEDFKDPLSETAISNLVKTLLDTATKFKNDYEDILTKCAEALAIIGALDSNKFQFKSIKNQVVLLHDFRDYDENVIFLRHFMENEIIKHFWASNNPVRQLFFAYAMQKFLEVLNLNVSVLDSTRNEPLVTTWNSFGDVAKSTLTPLLSSKYVSPTTRYEPIHFPYYKIGMKYEKWLVDFTSDLLKRPQKSSFDTPNEIKKTVFETCSMLVKDQDISISQYLLKYVALSHIVNGDEETIEDIKNEMLHLLLLDVSKYPPDCFEQLKSCYQSTFEVLDYVLEWLSNATQVLNENNLLKAELSRIKKNINYADKFLQSIPMELIAKNSAECDSYERTILYIEKCYRSGKVDNMNMIGDISIVNTLQQTYANINDYDSLAGILKIFSNNNLSEKLNSFQYNENWILAQESFKVLSELGDTALSVKNNTMLLKSLSEHGLYSDVISTLSSKVDFLNLREIPMEWCIVGLQASMSSGNKSDIDKWLYVTDTIGNSKELESILIHETAKAIRFLFELKHDDFQKCVNDIYKLSGKSLVSSMASSITRNSLLMTELHSIFDLSLITSSKIQSKHMTADVDVILKERLGNTDQSFDTQWRILSMHRVAHSLDNGYSKIAENLLTCSQMAQKNSRYDIATKCIMQAISLNDSDANIEYAELLWAQGRQTEAIKALYEIIKDDEFKNNSQKSRVQLKYAEWLDESSHTSSGTIVAEYTKAYKLETTWDKPFYDLGKYYSKLMESQNDNTGFYEQHIIKFFLRALALSPSFIFEALPKVLTIWLDFAQTPRKTKEAERSLNQIIQDLKTYIDVIPVYVWYTAITQMLSRISHKHESSAQILSLIILKLATAYPKHSLWFILSHINSNDPVRKHRVSSIFKKLQESSKELSLNLNSASELFNTLIRLASFKILKRSIRRMSLKEDFGINNLDKAYKSLVIPVTSNLEIRLPALKHTQNISTAFPRSSSVTFDTFDDLVNIFHSLQMPRQIFIRGSNGFIYRLMVKKDDTRKDAKVVDFTTMINRLLLLNMETRKRNLCISNYAVVPLAENMGVIEFVKDVATMKSIIADQRRRMGQSLNDRKLFMKLDDAQKLFKSKHTTDFNTISDIVKLFNEICSSAPPVLYHWFISQFSDPQSWYLSRVSYIRSSAVMSMVGYIIGLGDRHCENILFFKKNGSVLHIDFDCLFEKGKSLPIPEIVPYRLTQNMIDAMGIGGIEGSFRISSEVTETILRDNEAPLMNILETLLYDPLLDWKTQQNPQEHLRKVRRKIRGLLDENEGLPMNVHGQVDVLIQEASSPENLCQMYGGWAPYI